MRFIFTAIAAASLAAAAAYASDVQVVAADIIVVDGHEWRIANIEAPQIDATCPEEKAFAAKAQAKLSEILSDGKIEVLPTGGHDVQQRGTARVNINGKDVGEKLISAKMAARRGHGRPWCFSTVADNDTAGEPDGPDGSSIQRGAGVSHGSSRLPAGVGMPNGRR